MDLKPGLYLVPTPIGNLGDMTFRAVEVLKAVDLVLAEDTRVTGKLLNHFEISNKMMAFHQNNEHFKVPEIVGLLKTGATIACCTDAGSPGISDPGFLLARACVEEGIYLEALPGATAFVPALTSSGLPSDRFVFEGFLPVKGGRRTRLKEIADRNITSVFYESPHRFIKTLEQLEEVLEEDRQISVARELTKIHHEVITGTLTKIKEHFRNKTPKGEFVIVISGNNER